MTSGNNRHKTLDQAYWKACYVNGQTGWDLGGMSPPLKAYVDQLHDRDIKILVPGAGKGYEVDYLCHQGFTRTYALDIAQPPLTYLASLLPDLPADRLVQSDFFDWEGNGFDLVLEQTFFCAISPVLRPDYVARMADLLKPGGKIVGLLFASPFDGPGPPFGGTATEYRELFGTAFFIRTLEPAYNSVKPRQGNELFFIFERK